MSIAKIVELVDEALVLVGDMSMVDDCVSMSHMRLQLQQYLVEIKELANVALPDREGTDWADVLEGNQTGGGR